MQQFKALVKLKWALAWRRSSQAAGNFFIGSLFILIGILLSLVVALVISFLAIGFKSQGEMRALQVLATVAFSLFLLFSGILPAIYLGSGPSDERVFLYFPIPRRRLFGISFLSGAFSVDHLLVLPGLFALLLAPSETHSSGLALVLVGGFYYLFAFAFSYAFAAWLSKTMKNRKSRERLMFLFVLALLAISFLAPLLEHQENGVENLKFLMNIIAPWLDFLPMFLMAKLYVAALEGSIHFQSMFILVVWILVLFLLAWLGFQSNLKGPGSENSSHASGLAWPFRVTPTWVSGTKLVIAAKEITYITRSLTGKMNFLVLPVIVILLSGKSLSKVSGNFGIDFQSFSLIGLSFYAALLIVPFATNSFGFEGHGFKTYAYSPTSGRVILAGKNLGLMVYFTLLTLLGTAMISLFQGFQFAQWINALLFQAFLFTIFVLVGNWSSIRFPAQRDPASMKNASSNVGALIGFCLVLYGGLMFSLAFLIPLLVEMVWLTPILTLLLFILHLLWYGLMLPKFGAWFEQRLPSMMEQLKSA